MRRSLASSAAAALFLISLLGCSGEIADPAAIARSAVPPAATAIVADSPRALLDAFGHAWNNLDAAHYGELFTADFQFQFSLADSGGNPFPDHSLSRADELQIAQHLFVTGTATLPPATRIVLTFDRTFIPEPDSRPGKSFPVHQEVKRNFVLSVDTGDAAYRITGAAQFFIVRGDSAAIPPDLAAHGFHADPNRWWIERWEDASLDFGGGIPATGATPTQTRTWGSVKALYLPD
jgi:hypothetical protein